MPILPAISETLQFSQISKVVKSYSKFLCQVRKSKLSKTTRLAYSHPGVADGKSETRSQYWLSIHCSSQIYHTATFDTDRIGSIPPVVPEHFCDPVQGLSGNCDMPPWHSLRIDGICPLVDVPRRNTSRKDKEYWWPRRQKSTTATNTHPNQHGMKMA